MADASDPGVPRRVRVWRHPSLVAGVSPGTTPRPVEVLADRLVQAARAHGGARRMVWLDPGGPTLHEASEGVLTAFPSEVVREPDAVRLARRLEAGARPPVDAPRAEPPLRFQGGWIGYLGYEAVASLEPVRVTARADLEVPLASWARHPTWFRHLPATGVLELWTAAAGMTAAGSGDGPALTAWVHWAEEALRAPFDGTTPMLTFPAHLTRGWDGWDGAGPAPRGIEAASCSFTKAGFEAAVRRVQEAVREGEVFQANLAHRLLVPTSADPFHVHLALRRLNPSPFAAYLEEDWGALVSNSPERLFRVHRENGRRVVEARPIAGTRPRQADPAADRAAMSALSASEKERAEHTMLVDLARNDLGRVSLPGSVTVDAFQTVERYSHVHHLVSNVRGVLRDDVGLVALLRALFPGGTITGAPKLRSIEVIDRVEPVARGPYTGSLGHVEADGTMDWNILIRTLVFTGGRVSVHAGAGIVADSDPASEFEETLHKAGAMLAALRRAEALRAHEVAT